MTSPRPLQQPLDWREVLGEQGGVIGRAQALLGGLTDEQWEWRLRTRWQSVLPGVAVAHTGPVTPQQQGEAAVLYAGAGAHLTADAALLQLGMHLPPPALVHVAVPEHRAVRPQPFRLSNGEPTLRLVPHRVRGLERLTHPVRTPPVLRAPVAALHAAAWAPSDRSGEWRVAAAVQQRITRPTDLRAALEQLPRLPRRALLRAVLDDVELGAHAASELDFLRFLRRYRLPAPDRLQRPVRFGTVRYLDAWWERQRVVAEMDGAHHRLVGTWDDDALRANGVQLRERHDRVLLLRFTAANLRHDAALVAAQLRAALG
jgi:very-short-patch-repair endonuclease